MGCVVSKRDDSQLVTLCRERKEVIRAAVDCRYALASAHILYFQSILDVGNSLNRFFEEGMVISVDSPRNSVSNHQSSGKDSHLEFLSSDSESELDSLIDEIHGGQGVLEPELSPPKNQSQPRLNLMVNHMKRSTMEIPYGVYEQPCVLPTTIQWQELLKSFAGYPPHGNGLRFLPFGLPVDFPCNDFRFAQYGYGVFSGVSTFVQPNDVGFPQYGNEAAFHVPMDLPPNNLRFSQYGNGVSFRVPMDLPPNNLRFPQYADGESFGVLMDLPPNPYYNWIRSSHATAPPPPPPPPPPLPEVSTWDYLDLFGSIDDVYSNYHSQSIFETRFGSNFPDLREAREREGIPDLEDETEQNPVKEASKEIEVEGDTRGDSGGGTSGAAPMKNDEVAYLAQEKEIKSNHDAVAQEKEFKSSTDSLLSDCSEEEDARKEGVSLEADEALTQEVKSSRPVRLTTLPTHGTRDLQEVVEEIRDAFETAFNSGKEVSMMLEVGKLPYLPMGTKLKVFYYRILGLLAPSMATSSFIAYTLQKQSASRTIKMVKANNGNLEKDVSVKSSDLLLTLEKLYVWERKLWKEVKDEERLRAIYDKKCKSLKYLDDRGAECSKIDTAQASIKSLLPKINVAVTTVDAISKRIHKLRDEELQPQVNELICRLIQMWKFMFKCHQKQFQSIMEAKTHVRLVNSGIQRDSSLRATLELEMKILKWGKRLNDWINAQKAFFKFLNDWLLKCLIQEPEETPDGIAPFSPSRIGAPPIFIICNDCYHALERISKTRILKAIQDFASSLHQLWEKQNEEQHQRLQAEYLSKDFEKRLKSLCERRGINWEQYSSSNIAATSEGPIESILPQLGGLSKDLNTLRKRLDEQKARHHEAVKQVDDAASSSLKGGLVSIFEALESFCSETLKALQWRKH